MLAYSIKLDKKLSLEPSSSFMFVFPSFSQQRVDLVNKYNRGANLSRNREQSFYQLLSCHLGSLPSTGRYELTFQCKRFRTATFLKFYKNTAMINIFINMDLWRAALTSEIQVSKHVDMDEM